MSDKTIIPRSSLPNELDAPRGSWWKTQNVVSLKCPSCGRSMVIPHQIAADGTVTPSVVCPHEHCEWHVFVRLSGWSLFS
jgi:uncharacterized OB-fold protein